VLDHPVPAGRVSRAGGELGCPKSLSKKYVEGRSPHPAVPPPFRMANRPTIPRSRKISIDTKVFDS